jgi:mono/diheme cytochrome c family protein
VKQREFARCMVRDVTDHVFNGNASTDDRRALLAVFERQGTLRTVMREALLRFARGGGNASAPAAIPATLQAQVEAHCGACHGGGTGPASFPADGSFSRELLQKMLRQVAFGDMPKPPAEMDAAERRALTRALIAALWADEASREAAHRYFDGAARGLPAHRGSAILGLVESRAGAHDEEASSWTFSDADRHDAVEMRPSFVITFALAALRTCQAAGHRGRALDACVERALDVEAAVKTPR